MKCKEKNMPKRHYLDINGPFCPSIGEGNGTPLQYSCLENPMDGGAWWAAGHGVAKSRTQLSDFTFTFHFHALEKEMAPHSSVLAWRIPGTGKPGGVPSMGLHRVGHDWSDLAAAACPSMKRIHSISWFEPSDCGLGRGVRLLSAAPEVRGDAHSHLTKENTCPILSQVVSHCSANVAGHLHFLTCPLLIYIIHSYQTVAIISSSLSVLKLDLFSFC